MRRCIAWFASIAIALTGAVALAGDDDHRALVPWKVLEPGVEPESSPLTLFWVPASRDELRRSELLASDELTLYSSQCVAMRVVRLDDYALLERLGVGAELPAVVLMNANGEIVDRAEEVHLADVEAMVREALEDRAGAAEAKLDVAREKAEAGEIDAAISLYRQVWEERCVCPRQARAAHKALKKLER